MINIDNYEIFFLDYLEGNLSEPQQKALECFLMEYPHLKEELEEMQIVEVEESGVSIPKQNLQAIPFQCDFDDFCVAKLEDDLSPEDASLFTKYLLADKDRTAAYLQYEKTKLAADTTIMYPNKSALKKHRIVLVPYWKVAVAASVLVMISITFNWLLPSKTVRHFEAIASLAPSELISIQHHDMDYRLEKRSSLSFQQIKTEQSVQQTVTPVKQATKPKLQMIALGDLQEITSKMLPLENEPICATIVPINRKVKQQPANSGLANIGLGWKSSVKREPHSLLYVVAKAGVNKISDIVKSKIKTEKVYDNQIEISILDVEYEKR